MFGTRVAFIGDQPAIQPSRKITVQFAAHILSSNPGRVLVTTRSPMPAQEGLKYMRAGWLQPVDDFLKNASLTAPDYNWNDFLDRPGTP
jgi:hypothetical protein